MTLFRLKINKLLARNGLTFTELADILGVDESTLSAYVDGVFSIDARTLLDMCEVLGLNGSEQVVLLHIAALTGELGDTEPEPEPMSRFWVTPEYLATLEYSGPAYDRVLEYANKPDSININDQNDQGDIVALAKALLSVQNPEYKNGVVTIISGAIGSEQPTSTGILAIVRNIQALILAADIIDLKNFNNGLHTQFQNWLVNLRHIVFSGAGPALSIIQCHEKRPNNFGTHAGAARILIDLYIGDYVDLAQAATVFKGWLGDRSAYVGFSFGDLDWQADPANPVGINPAGATKEGHSIDGVLPDDQRRSGGFTWPPPKENYVWEALQGAVVQTMLLENRGFNAKNWSQQAILRAYKWLINEAQYPADGDDTWIPWLIAKLYNLPKSGLVSPTQPGKGMGFTDWVYQ